VPSGESPKKTNIGLIAGIAGGAAAAAAVVGVGIWYWMSRRNAGNTELLAGAVKPPPAGPPGDVMLSGAGYNSGGGGDGGGAGGGHVGSAASGYAVGLHRPGSAVDAHAAIIGVGAGVAAAAAWQHSKMPQQPGAKPGWDAQQYPAMQPLQQHFHANPAAAPQMPPDMQGPPRSPIMGSATQVAPSSSSTTVTGMLASRMTSATQSTTSSSLPSVGAGSAVGLAMGVGGGSSFMGAGSSMAGGSSATTGSRLPPGAPSSSSYLLGEQQSMSSSVTMVMQVRLHAYQSIPIR
jgi:hypothetical protein